MERRIYQLTERDLQTAQDKAARRGAQLAEIESHAPNAAYWKRRRTTYGLAKRDVMGLALAAAPDYYEGRGQGMLDVMSGWLYSEERRGPAYNAGYHDGYHFSYNEMHGYVERNPNFAHLLAEGVEVVYARIQETRERSKQIRNEGYEVARQEARASAVEIRTPYNAEFVTAIKRIPGREWNAARRVWTVPSEQAEKANKLVAKYFPSPSAAPAASQPAPTPAKTEVAPQPAAPTPPQPISDPTPEPTYVFSVSMGDGTMGLPDIYQVGNTVSRKTDDSVWVIASIDISYPDEDNDDFDYRAWITCRPATEAEAVTFWENVAAKKARRAQWERLQVQQEQLFPCDSAHRVTDSLPTGSLALMWEGKSAREYGSIRYIADADQRLVQRITNYYDGYDLGMEAPSVIYQFDLTPERARFLSDLAAYRQEEQSHA